MEIICPQCQFSRQVDETKIPARAQLATCPKCKVKFQFRDLPEEGCLIDESEKPLTDSPQSTGQDIPTAAPEKSAEPKTIAEPPVDEDPIIAPLTTPEKDTKDGLWDKLDAMSPPQKHDENDAQATLPLADSETEPIPGWTGKFSEDFPDPMQDDMDGNEEEENIPLIPPPFEQLDRYGFFHGLYLTVKLILTSPRLFFSVMPVGGGLAKPLTFTILLTMIQGFVQYFWGMVGLSPSVSPGEADAMVGVAGTVAPLVMLLFMPAVIAAGQFLITGVYHLLLMITRTDRTGFEGTFRALAYANAPIILGIFPMPVVEVEIGWMFAAAIWGLFLTITGLKYIHKTSYSKVIPVCLIPLLLAMIAGILVLQSGIQTI